MRNHVGTFVRPKSAEAQWVVSYNVGKGRAVFVHERLRVLRRVLRDAHYPETTGLPPYAWWIFSK